MIGNIVDRRHWQYRFKKINAAIEPTRHDNRVKTADRAPRDAVQDAAWIGYAEKEHITVTEAIKWASKHKDLVTLYLYGPDSGIYPMPKRKQR